MQIQVVTFIGGKDEKKSRREWENECKSADTFVSWVQCYFKLNPDSVEKRSFRALLEDIVFDLRQKHGTQKAREIITARMGK